MTNNMGVNVKTIKTMAIAGAIYALSTAAHAQYYGDDSYARQYQQRHMEEQMIDMRNQQRQNWEMENQMRQMQQRQDDQRRMDNFNRMMGYPIR
jgi:hypothetical protein